MKEWLTIRNALGVVMLIVFVRMTGAFFGQSQTVVGGFGPALGAMVPLVLAAILFSKSLSDLAARPLTNLIDSIYFGSNHGDPPPVSVKLARFYRESLRFPEAIAECERQLEFHPRSAELWEEFIRTEIESGDLPAACKLLRRACRKLNADGQRQLVNALPDLCQG